MPAFLYKAKKDSAETVTGQITALTQEEAIELICRQGLLPLAVEEKTPEAQMELPEVSVGPLRIKSHELYHFSRQLVQFLKSGVPLIRALEVIRDQTASSHFQEILTEICQEVRNGREFSSSLKEYPEVFSPLYISCVHAGEESGALYPMLLSVADYQKRQAEMTRKVRSAFMYPLFMAGVGLATIVFLLLFVLPRMGKLFVSLGDHLPWPTLVLLKASAFLSQYWYGFLLAGLGLIAFLNRWWQTQSGRILTSRFQLGIPVYRDFVIKVELARFGRTLELLLKSGMNLLMALRLSIPVLGNCILRREFLKLHEAMLTGYSMGGFLKKSKWIPPMVSHLLSMGEESGALPETMADIAQTFEEETSETIKRLTTLLEPSLILLVGLVIGFMIFAILLPIFQLDVLAY